MAYTCVVSQWCEGKGHIYLHHVARVGHPQRAQPCHVDAAVRVLPKVQRGAPRHQQVVNQLRNRADSTPQRGNFTMPPCRSSRRSKGELRGTSGSFINNQPIAAAYCPGVGLQ
eukprot:9437616-Pyramimonas_sp.AAC.2